MKKRLIATALVLAITFTFTSCGNHGWEDIENVIFGSSSSDYSSSSLKANSSSSEYTDDTDGTDEGGGVAPPDNYASTPPSIANSQGTVIVGPLLKTQWGKGSPYDPFWVLPDGQTGWIMCHNIAIAQIMKYHNYPKRGMGQSKPCEPCIFYEGKKDEEGQKVVMPSVSFAVDYDWSNMLNSYMNVNPTEQQRNAILTLLHRVALGGEFVENFGYDKSIQWRYHKHYYDSSWEEIIRKQLDSGLPVYYAGSDSIVGVSHAIVIDGYDSEGKFHVNWGWGGTADGYYSLDSLNPGHSKYPNGFSYDARMTINIQPDKGGVVINEMALSKFTTSKTSVPQNEKFSVKASIYSLGYFPEGQAGAALVDDKGKIVAVIGTTNLSETDWAQYPTVTINSVVPQTVNPGQYTLKIVTRPTGGEWKTVDLFDRTKKIPNAIDFYVYPPNSYITDITLHEFKTDKNYVQISESFTVSVRMVSRSNDFPDGQAGAVLVDKDNKIVSVVGNIDLSVVKRGSDFEFKLSCIAPEKIEIGQYRLRIAIKLNNEKEWMVVGNTRDDTPNAIDFVVKPGSETNGCSEIAFEEFSAVSLKFSSDKISVIHNELFNIAMKFTALNEDELELLGIALVDKNGKIVSVIKDEVNSIATAYNYGGYIVSECTIPESVPPGQYNLRIVVKTKGKKDWILSTNTPQNYPISFIITVLDSPSGPVIDKKFDKWISGRINCM